MCFHTLSTLANAQSPVEVVLGRILYATMKPARPAETPACMQISLLRRAVGLRRLELNVGGYYDYMADRCSKVCKVEDYSHAPIIRGVRASNMQLSIERLLHSGMTCAW